VIGFLRGGMWRALGCALRRRQDGVVEGVTAFRSPPPSVTSTALLLAIGAAAVVTALLGVPWLWLQLVLVPLAVWVMLFGVALLVVGTTHPHLLTPDALVLRVLARTVARVPRSAIEGVALVETSDAPAPSVANGRLHLPGPSGETNVRLDLEHDVEGSFSPRLSGAVRQITLDVTTPLTLVGEITGAQPPTEAAPR